MSLDCSNGTVLISDIVNEISAVDKKTSDVYDLVDMTSDPSDFLGWAGDTASRPTLNAKPYGHPYLDTDLNKPIWWTGSEWVDSSGNAV